MFENILAKYRLHFKRMDDFRRRIEKKIGPKEKEDIHNRSDNSLRS